MYTDACDNGVCAILEQDGKTVGLFSAKLSKTEKNYSVCEKEMFAVFKALLHFRNLIYGAEIIIKTDNLNNTYNIKNINGRIA